jgi:pimeloyl-ACP methyl ester carboxylesterase
MRIGRIVAILAAVFVGLLLVTYARYHRFIVEARERVAIRSQLVQTPCGPIEYAAAGDGPPVLVVHGAGGGYDQGLDFGQALVPAGVRIIAMSRFGYLRTPLPPDPSAAAQANAHACLLDALQIPRAAIVGASAGAPSAMQFALMHPDRCKALVLLVPAAYVPRKTGEAAVRTPPGTAMLFDTALRSDFLLWAAIHLARPTVTQAILATPPAVLDNASAEEKQRARQVLEHIFPVSERRLGLINDGAIVSSIQRYALESISCPALMISVADDLFGTYDVARYTAEHIPHARLVTFPTGGHLWIGHQEEVVSQISAFVK